MAKPDDISQQVWDTASQKANDYLWWLDECWPHTAHALPIATLAERLTYDFANAIRAETERCASYLESIGDFGDEYKANALRGVEGYA